MQLGRVKDEAEGRAEALRRIAHCGETGARLLDLARLMLTEMPAELASLTALTTSTSAKTTSVPMAWCTSPACRRRPTSMDEYKIWSLDGLLLDRRALTSRRLS